MKQFVKGVSLTGAVWVFAVAVALAQFGPNGYNPNSVRPILESDVMYRTTVWRKINLLEKQNKPFFATQNEITRVIIEGVREGKLQPYEVANNPRIAIGRQMDTTTFFKTLRVYDPTLMDTIPVKPEQIFILELKEDYIFDRRRSLRYWDIQSINLVVPQGTTAANSAFDLPLATFRFKDLYDYFKASYDESETKGTFEDMRAFWYNPENPRRHMSLADAFELRLFSSRITKVSNPNDDDITIIVNNEYGTDADVARKILYMSQKMEYDLMEFEHNLWEF